MPTQCTLLRACLLVVLFLIGDLAAQGPMESAALWARRTVDTTRALLNDPNLPGYDKEFAIAMACLALGQQGRMNQGVELCETRGLADGLKYRQEGLLTLADGLSTAGHIENAVKIVEAIDNEKLRGTTLSLVAIRPSQRGDFKEAEDLLPRVPAPLYRDRAASQICREYIKSGKYDDAKRLSLQITDEEARSKVDEEIEKQRNRPLVTDNGYVEFQLQEARKRPFGSASDSELEFLNHYYRAVVALEVKDQERFDQESQAARRLTDMMTDNDSVLLLLGRMFYKAGKKENSRRLYQRVLGNYLSKAEVNPFDFNMMLFSTGPDSDAKIIAECFTEEELKKALEDLMPSTSATIVAAPLFGATVALRKPVWVEQVYQATSDLKVKASLATNSLLMLPR